MPKLVIYVFEPVNITQGKGQLLPHPFDFF